MTREAINHIMALMPVPPPGEEDYRVALRKCLESDENTFTKSIAEAAYKAGHDRATSGISV